MENAARQLSAIDKLAYFKDNVQSPEEQVNRYMDGLIIIVCLFVLVCCVGEIVRLSIFLA